MFDNIFRKIEKSIKIEKLENNLENTELYFFRIAKEKFDELWEEYSIFLPENLSGSSQYFSTLALSRHVNSARAMACLKTIRKCLEQIRSKDGGIIQLAQDEGTNLLNVAKRQDSDRVELARSLNINVRRIGIRISKVINDLLPNVERLEANEDTRRKREFENGQSLISNIRTEMYGMRIGFSALSESLEELKGWESKSQAATKSILGSRNRIF